MIRSYVLAATAALASYAFASRGALAQSDQLPSWNDGAAKKAITDFVSRVTAQGGADWQMLQRTAAGPGARFAGIVHDTDEAREYAYDRPSKIGNSTRHGTGQAKGWTVVDMKQDWRKVFAFEPEDLCTT